MLAVHVGVGGQVFVMCLVTLFFALFGFLSPANRGGLMSAMLVFFVFSGALAGFVSARSAALPARAVAMLPALFACVLTGGFAGHWDVAQVVQDVRGVLLEVADHQDGDHLPRHHLPNLLHHELRHLG